MSDEFDIINLIITDLLPNFFVPLSALFIIVGVIIRFMRNPAR